MATAEQFVQTALTYQGQRYIFGAETDASRPPEPVDCSELTQVAAAKVGVTIPDGAINQFDACRRAGTLVSVDEGTRTRGALLFRTNTTPRHVAISLGDGRTIEARGRAYGVGVFSAYGRGFNHAGRVPGLTYGPTFQAAHTSTMEVPELDANEHLTLQQTHDAVGNLQNQVQWLENLFGEMYQKITGKMPPPQPR